MKVFVGPEYNDSKKDKSIHYFRSLLVPVVIGL